MPRRTDSAPSLGEWACLGVLFQAPAHGFAVAARLKPGGDIGRVWSVSRALTYRALDQLIALGYVEEHAVERGIAGGDRTVLRATRSGRAAFRQWITTPVAHLRDVRSELLLKLLLADQCGIDIGEMLVEQRRQVASMHDTLTAQASDSDDVIAVWRRESAGAALSFLDIVIAPRNG
jgi:PadR family transcriptional regulator AphA